MNVMRRNRRCHNVQMPVPPKRKFYYPGCLCIMLLLCTLVTPYKLFAQLTYENLIVDYDSSWVCKNLKLIPVKFKDKGTPQDKFLTTGIMTFEEALHENKISVKEMSLPGGPDVGMLTIKNHSKKSIIVQSGEMIAGGKQDRAFAISTIIPPGEGDNFIPVFCVEKGRWDHRLRTFRYAGPANVSLRKKIDIEKKQNKVWKEIDRQLSEQGVTNASGAYIDLYRDTASIDSSCFRMLKKKMTESDSLYAGFIAVTGNRIIDCELFGSSDLCIASFDAMLKSYLRSINANDGVPNVSDTEIKNFLDDFLQSEPQQQKYLSRHGSIYTYQNHVIHLIAYND